jgi:hypothetical protein
VSRMGDIYSQAARVIAWIGQNDYESRYGRAFLSELTSISAESSPIRRHLSVTTRSQVAGCEQFM